MAKPRPERVNPAIARQVMQRTRDRQSAYSDYIVLHFRMTGQLAPGCDAKDFFAWWDANVQEVGG